MSDMVLHACNPRIWEAESGWLRVQISLGYKVNPWLKKLKPKQTEIETTNDDQRIFTSIALQTWCHFYSVKPLHKFYECVVILSAFFLILGLRFQNFGILLFQFLALLETESRALSMLDKFSTSKLDPQYPFYFLFWGSVPPNYLGSPWICNPRPQFPRKLVL